MVIDKNDPESAAIAASYLRERKTLVLPTDTIYGFSGVAPYTKARIIAIKGRDEGKPFIELIPNRAFLEGRMADDVNPSLLALWPGAVTIIINTIDGMTTAFRCPGDPWLREVLELTGECVYSTSVNRSGQKPLVTIEEITKEFGTEVDLVIDAGNAGESRASTIVDATGTEYRIVRQGSVIVPERCLKR
jgi:L-threonylcarbamoyladenylate synthase